jgi:hypothetical protein
MDLSQIRDGHAPPSDRHAGIRSPDGAAAGREATEMPR